MIGEEFNAYGCEGPPDPDGDAFDEQLPIRQFGGENPNPAFQYDATREKEPSANFAPPELHQAWKTSGKLLTRKVMTGTRFRAREMESLLAA
jgi:hypothetical protein